MSVDGVISGIELWIVRFHAGLSRLDALGELDLSDNLLLDHKVLAPLGTLIALQMLNLSGNPLACHSKHRQITATHLHPNTTSGRVSWIHCIQYTT